MSAKCFYSIFFCLVLILCGCTDEPLNEEQILTSPDLQVKVGATQISGVGFYADPADCDFAGEGADFALLLTGELEGCLYVFVEDYDCSPSGTYRESGQELFVGYYNGEEGSFMTDYKFEAKYEGCEDDFFVGAEIFGRCQHPIVKESGTGVFEGVTGRLDFKDNVETGEFPYKGHLRY